MQNESITYITAKSKWYRINFKELWRYRDLILLFVKRNITTSYKQTILGPLWIIINPLISTVVFTVIFGVIANTSPAGVPQFLFYMSGNLLWSFFSSCLGKGSGTFLGNARLFGKVYFPRLCTPVADMAYSFLNYAIQMIVFVILTIVYACITPFVQPNWVLALVPLMVLQIAVLGMGVGLIISSITTKYRDLNSACRCGCTSPRWCIPWRGFPAGCIRCLCSIPWRRLWKAIATPFSARAALNGFTGSSASA